MDRRISSYSSDDKSLILIIRQHLHESRIYDECFVLTRKITDQMRQYPKSLIDTTSHGMKITPFIGVIRMRYAIRQRSNMITSVKTVIKRKLRLSKSFKLINNNPHVGY